MLSEVLAPILAMEPEHKKPYLARPSSAGRCERALLYHRMGAEPKDLPDRTLHIFRDGTWHEELTADLLRKTSFHLHSEQMAVTIPAEGLNPKGYSCSVCNERVRPNVLHGHIDGIIQTVDGREFLWEHKALSRFQFDRYSKILEAGEVPDPSDYYMSQLHLYLASEELKGSGITTALFHIKCKDTSQMVDFEVPFAQAVADQALAKLRAVETNAEAGTMIPRPYDRNVDWQCGYCLWEAHCYKDYETEIEGRKTDVVIEDETVRLAIDNFKIARAERMIAEKDEKRCKTEVQRWMSANQIADATTPDGAKIKLKTSERKAYTVQAKQVETCSIQFPKAKGKKGGSDVRNQ